MTKAVQYYFDKIDKMKFPSFLVFDLNGYGSKSEFPLNRSHKFVALLAHDFHYCPFDKTLKDMFIDAVKYAYWAKCEYEHWDSQMNIKYENDGYYEQFLRWVNGLDLDIYLKTHELNALYEIAKKRYTRKDERNKKRKV